MTTHRDVAALKAMAAQTRRLKENTNGKIGGLRLTHESGTHPAKPQPRRKMKNGGASISRNGEHAVQPAPLPKTKLSAKELDMFKLLLLEKRQEILGDVAHMENEALGKNRSDAAGDLSMMPIHMADIGTDNYEQEFTLGLVAGEREVLKEIDAALERIREGTFGNCLATHKPISKTRLKARPWARYCIQYKREEEKNHRR